MSPHIPCAAKLRGRLCGLCEERAQLGVGSRRGGPGRLAGGVETSGIQLQLKPVKGEAFSDSQRLVIF